MYLKSMFIMAVLLMPICALAQTLDSNNSSNSTSSTSSGAASINSGVSANLVQNGSDTVHYRGGFEQDVRSQVPLSVVGYGSFSQMNCQNAMGLGATSRVFSFVYNGPKDNLHCERAVRSDQFGRESQLALTQGKTFQAELLRATGVWETCMSSQETQFSCLSMGLIKEVELPLLDSRGEPTGKTTKKLLPAPNVKTAADATTPRR